MLLHLGSFTGLEGRGVCGGELGVEGMGLVRGRAKPWRIPPGCVTCF